MATQTGGIDLKAMKKAHDQALAAAEAIEQFFWHNSQDSGAGEGVGAHITEVPQEDFIADPANGGGNLLARSNGIAVRDGLTELATFGANGAQIGASSTNHTVIDSNGQTFFGSNGITETGRIGPYGFRIGTAESPWATFTSSRAYIRNYYINDGSGTPKLTCTLVCNDGEDGTLGSNYREDEPYYTFGTRAWGKYAAPWSWAIGEGIIGRGVGTVYLGRYNVEETTLFPEGQSWGGPALVVGNGTSNSNRSNAFTISATGDVEAAGSIKANGHNTAIGYKTGRQTGTYSLASGTTWVTVPAANLSRITLGAGTWIIHAHAAFESNNTGRRALEIYSVTESGELTRSFVNQTATNGAATNMQTSAIVTPSSNTTYTLRLAQNSGSAKSVDLVLEAVRIA